MTPTISRMIHVSYPADPAIPCRAAIVTGIDHAPTPTIYATVFSRDGKMSGVVIDALAPTWHDPRDCAEITTGITSYTPVPAEQWLVCPEPDCGFAVERGEGRTMALHRSEDHDGGQSILHG